MNTSFRFKNLTLLVFGFYLFWDIFGLDIIVRGAGVDRLPLHRVYILLTAFIFLFNIQSVLFCFSKNKLFIVLLFYILLSAAWSYTPTDTIKGFIFLFSSMSISLMAALAFRDNQIKLIKWLFILTFLMDLACVLIAVKYPQYGINTRDFGKIRWIGITDHPNKLGALSVITIWLGINYYFLTTKKIVKIFNVIAIIIAFFLLLKADSMTSMLASLAAVSYTTYLYVLKTKSPGLKIALFVFTFIVGLGITTFYMSSTEIVHQSLESSGRDTTLTGRTLLWANGLKALAEHPINGLGFDNLDQLTKKYHIRMSHLHNGYIEFLVKGGILGGILVFLILLGTFFKQLALSKLENRRIVLLKTGFIAILIHNFAESSLFKGFNSLSLILIFIIVSTTITYLDFKNENYS